MPDVFERAKSSDCQVDAAVYVLEHKHTWDIAIYIYTGIHIYNCYTYIHMILWNFWKSPQNTKIIEQSQST